MRSEASVEVDRPIHEVFECATKHVAEWSIIVVEDEVVEEKPEGVGTTFRSVTEERGRRMEFDGVVTRHEPPTAQAVSMKGQYFDIEAEYAFEDLGGDRTRVTQRSKVRGKGFFKLMLAVMGLFMKRSSCDAAQQELESLKRFAEARAGAAAG